MRSDKSGNLIFLQNNGILFCIPLAYSYLCQREIDETVSIRSILQQLKILRKCLYAVPVAVFAAFGMTATAQQKGKATFYSKRSNGARTASGERLHNDSLVCAHRTHPFGTLLKVKNPANGKKVVVRVIDRGPFARGRIIDLSYRAARELGITTQGVAMVEVSVYKPEVVVPYKPEDIFDVPELDMEVVDRNEQAVPQWQEDEEGATTPAPQSVVRQPKR